MWPTARSYPRAVRNVNVGEKVFWRDIEHVANGPSYPPETFYGYAVTNAKCGQRFLVSRTPIERAASR